MTPEENAEHILAQRVPRFLNRLDEEPLVAWQEFHAFAWKLLQAYPPRVFSELSPEERADLISEIVLDCQLDNFRKLRSYRDQGMPFAAWLGSVARNRAISKRRRDGLRDRARGQLEPRQAPQPDDEVHHVQLLEVVRECMSRMAEGCRLLLQAAAEGFKPGEIALLLGPPARDGKQISDALRSCRKTLKLLLQKQGY